MDVTQESAPSNNRSAKGDQRINDLSRRPWLRCNVCQALLDDEDLFCSNCGKETPETLSSPPLGSQLATHNFVCESCGGAMSYDASVQALACPFCGSHKLQQRPDHVTIQPEKFVPFRVTRQQAEERIRGALASGFWIPGDAATHAAMVEMKPIMLPYWVFCTKTKTFWSADTSRTPSGARASWAPLTGQHAGECEGLLVGGGGALSVSESSNLAPFDLSEAMPIEEADLEHVIYEPFLVTRRNARQLAVLGVESLESAACRQYVPDRCRNLKVNVLLEGLSGHPYLLPVWILAYRYRGKAYRYLINGQTGKHFGETPISRKKQAIAVGLVILIIAAIAAFFFFANR